MRHLWRVVARVCVGVGANVIVMIADIVLVVLVVLVAIRGSSVCGRGIA